jgi:hypothetical protein
MLFSYGYGQQQQINGSKKYTSNTGNFDHHADAAVQCRVHCPMEHIPGFTRGHWMPPWGECLHRIALAAAMVIKFVETTQNTIKTQLELATTVHFDH